VKKIPILVLVVVLTVGLLKAQDKTPLIFDVADVVVGPQRIETTWAYAVGKWSDAGDNVAVNSTQIHCYKRFGFCEDADAYVAFGKAVVNANSFDILRWDSKELIAVDNSPICMVNTLRFDFAAKTVTLSSALKGDKLALSDPVCKAIGDLRTAFLEGGEKSISKQ
jgi:hypothetical protein